MSAHESDAEVADAAREYVRELDEDGPRDSGVKVYRAMKRLRTAIAATPGEPLHEWICPRCGATTRARMADRPAGDP